MDLLASCCSVELCDHCAGKVRGKKSSEGAEELQMGQRCITRERAQNKSLAPHGAYSRKNVKLREGSIVGLDPPVLHSCRLCCRVLSL